MAKDVGQSRSNLVMLGAIVVLVAACTVACVYFANRPAGDGMVAGQVGAGDLISEDRILYGGMPRATAADAEYEVLKNRAYVVGYSEQRKDPLWAAYRVCRVEPGFSSPRPRRFSEDARSAAHAKESDYTGSGYDRGHMAPNSAIVHCYGPEAQLETFLMTNVCPQSPNLNEKVWEKLEVLERGYGDSLEEVWVIDGPIFADLNGGVTHRLAGGEDVPSAFYKIVIDEEGHVGGKARVFAVIMPQDVKGTELPQQYVTTIEEIQKETHLDFLWKLDAATQGELEGRAWGVW